MFVSVLVTQAFGQGFLVVYPGGGSIRWYFDYPKTVDPGVMFSVQVLAEHVPYSAPVTPMLRATAQPSPIVFPVSTSGDCDPNWCTRFPLLASNDQFSLRMFFSTQASAPPGSPIILKIDTASVTAPNQFQTVTDLQIQITPAAPTTVRITSVTTSKESTTITEIVQPRWDPFVLASALMAGIVVVGIVAVVMLTRRKAPAPSPYKPIYGPTPPVTSLKPSVGPGQQIKPGGPRILGKRIEEKK